MKKVWKKGIAAIIAVSMIVSNIGVAGAEENAADNGIDIEQKTFPVVETISLDKTEVETPDTIAVSLMLSEHESEIAECVVTFKNKSNEVGVSANMQKNEEEWNGVFDINTEITSGDYLIHSVRLVDIDGDYIYYYNASEDMDSLLDETLSDIVFSVANPYMLDKNPPELINIELITPVVKAGDEASVVVEAKDDMSKVNIYSMCVCFANTQGDILYFYGRSEEEGKITLASVLDAEVVSPGEYYLQSISMYDMSQNGVTYLIDADAHMGVEGVKELPEEFKELYITVENDKELDTNPPELINIELITPVVKAGDEASVVVEAKDDMSKVNIYSMCVGFANTQGDILCFYGRSEEEGKITLASVLDAEVVSPGEYYLQNISMYDMSQNGVTYLIDADAHMGVEGVKELPEEFKELYITVENDKELDTNPPELINIELMTPVVKAGDEASVVVEAKDDMSKVNIYSMCVGFANTQGDILCFYGRSEEEGKITLASVLDAEVVSPGEYYLQNISMYDMSQNGVTYLIDADAHMGAEEVKELPEEFKTLYITVENEKDILHIPEVNSIVLDKTEVNVPDSVEVVVDIDIEENGVDACKYVYKCAENERYREVELHKEYFDVDLGKYVEYEDGKWHGEINLDEYQEEGTYALAYLWVKDGYGNEFELYADSEHKYSLPVEMHSIIFVICENKETYDGELSTDEENWFEAFENIGEASNIFVDIHNMKEIPKEFFDYLRDSERRVCFGDESIQWVFKGEDIVNASKDIDLNVEVIPLDSDKTQDGMNMRELMGEKDAMVVRFPENGDLSGKCQVRVTADYSARKYLGKEALFVYYYNSQSQEFEEISVNTYVTEDNCIEFEIEHCSDYIITNEKLDEGNDAAKYYGDSNSDGKINVLDAVLMKKYIAGYENLNIDLDACDVNVDGRINVLDAVMLLKYIAGYEIELGNGEQL